MGELLGSYLVVPDLHTSNMYNEHEAYLEEYLSVVKGSSYTYFEALKEASSRCLNVAYLLDLNPEHVKLSHLCRRMGVDYSDEWDHNPNSKDRKGVNFLYPVYNTAEGKGETSMSRCLVNVVMHLFLSALVGPSPLHSDNRDTFALNIYRFMAQRHMPSSAIPSRTILFDTFDMDGSMKPQVTKPPRCISQLTGGPP